jgi:hypothetical protein
MSPWPGTEWVFGQWLEQIPLPPTLQWAEFSGDNGAGQEIFFPWPTSRPSRRADPVLSRG